MGGTERQRTGANTQPCSSSSMCGWWGCKPNPPSSGGGLAAPFSHRDRGAQLWRGAGGIGLHSGSAAALCAGCLSQGCMAALTRIKRYCSQPKNCQGSAGRYRRLTASEIHRRSLSHPRTHPRKPSSRGPC